MGMFDNIKVEMVLPEWPDELKIESFQTKSTPRQAMINYKITPDGSLYEERAEYEWVDDESTMGGHFKTVYSDWVFCSYITQEISFYHYWNHPNYIYEEAFYFETGNIEYNVKVIKGKVADVKCVGKKMPVELSDDEVELKRIAYENNAKATRDRMVESRKNHPTASQKLADDITSLITNKPAVSDQSDYIKIINNIEELVKNWRKSNDPWYE